MTAPAVASAWESDNFLNPVFTVTCSFMVHSLSNSYLNRCWLKVTRPHLVDGFLDAGSFSLPLRMTSKSKRPFRRVVESGPGLKGFGAKKLGSGAQTHGSGTEQYRNVVTPCLSGTRRIVEGSN